MEELFELRSCIEEAVKESYPIAMKHASLEAFEGMYTDEELSGKVDQDRIVAEALDLVLKAQQP